MGVAYIISIPGLIKVTEEVFNCIAVMCIAFDSWMTPTGEAFLVASIGAFILTSLLLIFFVLDLHSRISLPWSWSKVQFIYCFVWALFYFITTTLVIERGWRWNDNYVAGGAFGLFATITYVFDGNSHYNLEQEAQVVA